MSPRLKFTLIPCGILAAWCAVAYFKAPTRPTDRERVAAAREALKQSEVELQIYQLLYQKITIDNLIKRIKSESIRSTAERYGDELGLAATIEQAEKLLQKIKRLENIQAVSEAR